MLGGDIQWGRHAEVSFTNFDSGLVTTIKSNEINEKNEVIGDGLRITFEYTKNDDQGYSSPNGKIVIYGLTEKTFNAIGERLKCEVELKAGYLKSTKNSPKRLFYAVLMDKKYEIENGMTVATFEVLGDFLEKVIASKMALNLPKPTLIDIMISISDSMNKGFAMKLSGTDEQNDMLANSLQKWIVSPYGYSFASTPQQELKRIRDAFGVTYRVEKDMVVFSILDSWFDWHLDRAINYSNALKAQASTALVAENKTPPKSVDTKPTAKEQKIDLVKTHALVLSPDTGLIGSPTLGNPIVDKDYDANLASGEEVWNKKQQKVIRDKKTGEVKKDKKTGEVKMTKRPRKMKVARRTVTAKCYINSMLNFDAQVSIITESAICDGVYRVRSVKISGDTDGTDWFMELELNE